MRSKAVFAFLLLAAEHTNATSSSTQRTIFLNYSDYRVTVTILYAVNDHQKRTYCIFGDSFNIPAKRVFTYPSFHIALLCCLEIEIQSFRKNTLSNCVAMKISNICF